MKEYAFSLSEPKALTEEEIAPLLELAGEGRFARYAHTLVEELEQALADYYGTARAVTCSSGTGALQACLIALDLPPGSEVVTTSVADVGVVIPIVYENLVPVFADVDPETANMTAEAVEQVVTSRTSAVVAVHLAGNPCDLSSLVELCDAHGLALVEDFSQAHGATFAGRRIGSFGAISFGSFQQSKHLSSGEGGVVVTSDGALADRAALATDKGWQRARPLRERAYQFLAPNLRFSALQACVLMPQLRRLEETVARRRRLAADLLDRLAPLHGLLAFQRVLPEATHSYYAFLAVARRGQGFRDRLLETLAADFGVTCAFGYTLPRPLYLCANALIDPARFGRERAYSGRTYPAGTCPRAEELLERSFLLPFGDHLSDEDVAEIAARVLAAADRVV